MRATHDPRNFRHDIPTYVIDLEKLSPQNALYWGYGTVFHIIINVLKLDMISNEGPTLPKIAYEISKSLDFTEDFGISPKISGFPKDSRFHLRFRDFNKDFKISVYKSVAATRLDFTAHLAEVASACSLG